MANNFLNIALLFGYISVALLFFVQSRRMRRLMRREIRTITDLQENGVTIEGTIFAHQAPPFLVPSVVYQYQHEGSSYQNKQFVTKKDLKRLKDGASVPIRYLAHDPQTAVLIDCIFVDKYGLLMVTGTHLALIFTLSALAWFIFIIMRMHL